MIQNKQKYVSPQHLMQVDHTEILRNRPGSLDDIITRGLSDGKT